MTAYQSDPLIRGKWYVSTGDRQTAAENVFSPPFDSEEMASDWATVNGTQPRNFFVWQFAGKPSPAFAGE
jgi:hypothetical protein